MTSQPSLRVPGLERDSRGRIRVAKSIIQDELHKSSEGITGPPPSWESMVSGRLTGKYDLHPISASGAVSADCFWFKMCFIIVLIQDLARRRMRGWNQARSWSAPSGRAGWSAHESPAYCEHSLLACLYLFRTAVEDFAACTAEYGIQLVTLV